ncbi:hypothetical protein [Micromonospora schwarzwaldensis]|uniref:hypothetical protein n=1 Tax=Micromonospora sp. DSM 45708 TaxID=3111767 RepID=UPI0031DF4A90
MTPPVDLAHRLAHLRWLAGGTGAGKSTLARGLADRYDVLIYDGDRAERGYVGRCTAFAGPVRTRAGWGASDHDEALTLRLARDELWDAEIRRQAVASGLPVVTVDGSRDVRDLAARFRLR